MMSPSRLLTFLFAFSMLGAGVAFGQSSERSSVQAQDLPVPDDYAIFSASGEAASWEDVLVAMREAEAVLVGEQHNDSIGHQIEFRLLELMHSDTAIDSNIGVSFEMFDRDVQFIVDEYLDGLISEDHMVKSARAWDNYDTDYRPMLEFAREHNLGVVAANAPRRYVNRVSRLGEDSLLELPPYAQAVLPPLPVSAPSPEYQAKWDNVMAAAMEHMPAPDAEAGDEQPGHMTADEDDPANELPDEEEETAATTVDHGGFNLQRMFAAQNVWDAGMAYAIVGYLTDHPGSRVIHYVGSFHVESGSGLPDHVKNYRPGTSTLVIYIHPVQAPDTFDDELTGRGDFVIQTRDFQ